MQSEKYEMFKWERGSSNEVESINNRYSSESIVVVDTVADMGTADIMNMLRPTACWPMQWPITA